jgi:hypothetical protein
MLPLQSLAGGFWHVTPLHKSAGATPPAPASISEAPPARPPLMPFVPPEPLVFPPLASAEPPSPPALELPVPREVHPHARKRRPIAPSPTNRIQCISTACHKDNTASKSGARTRLVQPTPQTETPKTRVAVTTSPRFDLEVASAQRSFQSALALCEGRRPLRKSFFGLEFAGAA